MRGLMLFAALCFASPAIAQVTYPPPAVTAAQVSQAQSDATAAKTAAQQAQTTASAAATPAQVAAAVAAAPFVKTVQAIAPDSTGNVSGLATATQLSSVSSQLSTVMLAGDTIQVVTPTTGQTITPSAGVTVLLINNPSLLAALTVSMPTSPTDGQRFIVSSAAGVTLLSLTGGTIKGTLASLSLAGYARYIYSANAGFWFRTG